MHLLRWDPAVSLLAWIEWWGFFEVGVPAGVTHVMLCSIIVSA